MAVPAFIGSTQSGPALQPVRIASLAEYESQFGGAHNLHDSVRLFYANGGGTCYVVSVGDSDLLNGLAAIGEQDGVDVLVVPEAVGLSLQDYTTVIRAMLQQCGTREDRVAILDVFGSAGATKEMLPDIAETFRAAVGDQFLSFGAAYFPFLDAGVPPSGAMAGIYAKVDNEQGIWNAPANVALSAVTATTYNVTDADQDTLSPNDGKAINAIRQFIGKGTVAWGARTLDGNSNDYRYIQIRRTIIYIEQSIKSALNQFAFAPNDAATWATITSNISSFLNGLWKEGALQGAKPSDAYNVQCGLGTTMTAQDLQDGFVRVQVLVAMVRPAEFIVLTFQQQMASGE